MNKSKCGYDHIFKRCSVCHKVTEHIINSTSSECQRCETLFDDDADELFGPVDEAIE